MVTEAYSPKTVGYKTPIETVLPTITLETGDHPYVTLRLYVQTRLIEFS